jgi:dihydrofolate synthase/folylpolyglutamate synthase
MSIAALESLLFARTRGGMVLGLDRMQRAVAMLGHPERRAPVLHVAGTNGKGSTCALLEAICRASGLRTALYTSPHLQRFNERFRVDGAPASDDALLAAFETIRGAAPWTLDEPPVGLTFFELVTLLAFVAFAEAKPDVMVVEVGLGGRLDATNVVEPLVACITPVDLDHAEYLGETRALIAGEKAGIIKSGKPLVSARQAPDAAEVIATAAARCDAPLSVEGRDFSLTECADGLVYRSSNVTLEKLRLGLRGPHQRGNAAVALRTLELAREAGLATTDEGLRRGLAEARWPGRYELIRHAPDLYLDGAHNPHGARALAEALRRELDGRRLHLVMGLLADKSAPGILEPLLPLASTLTVTTPSSARALPAAELALEAARLGKAARVEAHPEAALEQALAGAATSDLVLVCGSLYLVGELRAALLGERRGGPSEAQFRPASRG